MILNIFANSLPSALNFKCFSRSLEHFFLTVGQNNFGNKIPYLLYWLQRSISFWCLRKGWALKRGTLLKMHWEIVTKAKRVRPQRLMLSPYCRGVASGGPERLQPPPRNLADQLTLFEPGGQILPLTLLPTPRIQKAIYTSVLWWSMIKRTSSRPLNAASLRRGSYTGGKLDQNSITFCRIRAGNIRTVLTMYFQKKELFSISYESEVLPCR